jgi:hypothetical protein
MSEFADARCPRCGSTLITNGARVWCSFVGGRGPNAERPCQFGLDRAVRPDELGAAPAAAVPSPDPLGATELIPPGALDLAADPPAR